MPDPATVTARQTHKRCPDCRRLLPAEAFYLRPDGYLSAYCKADVRRPEAPTTTACPPRRCWPPCAATPTCGTCRCGSCSATSCSPPTATPTRPAPSAWWSWSGSAMRCSAGTPACSTATPTTTPPPATPSEHDDTTRRPTNDPRASCTPRHPSCAGLDGHGDRVGKRHHRRG